jgi:hypothetical protein
MNNVINVLHDTNTHALECKREFGNEYDNYCSYLGQWIVACDGKKTKLVPVSYNTYMRLGKLIREPSDKKVKTTPQIKQICKYIRNNLEEEN